MRFTCQVDIEADLDRVISKFDNPDNLKEWQDGFVSMEHHSGEVGMPGAKSIMRYKTGRGEMELVETILVRDLPHEFSGRYEFAEGANTMHNYFEELGNGITRWTAEVEYYEINSFMMKVMTKLLPSMFRKQTQKWMDQFKIFVESKHE